MSEHSKFLLADSQIPTVWVNVLPSLTEPLDPPLHPQTRAPLTPQDLLPIFPMELIEQEFSPQAGDRYPGRSDGHLPAVARHAALPGAAPGKGARHPGAHLLQVRRHQPGRQPQAEHRGARRPTTTSAPASAAWPPRPAPASGAARSSLACQLFGLECTVYMVRISYDQKPYRRMMMHAWGAEVFPSPSDHTNSGRGVLAATPDSPGSLGIAISEAVEDAATHADTNYALGSVLNHVMLHQTVIGQEAKLQMELAGEEPDVVIGCFGGGSNFGGLALPYVLDRLAGKGPRILAVEPSACPSLTRARFAYDFGDTAKLTPLIKMYTLGHDFVPPGIHAGGLRYHGASPLLSHLLHCG